MDPNIPIRKIMTSNLVTVSPESLASEVEEIFDKHNFHHLPVVSPGRKLVGIISKEDFQKIYFILSMSTTGKTWTKKELAILKANNFMTKYPVFLDPDDSIGLAADIFLANKFHSLPIVEDDQLIGIITTHDLLAYSYKAAAEIKEVF